MTPVDRVSLLQKDFSQFVCGSFRDLQADRDFSDVTLVCEDNHQVAGHRVVLAASSPVLGGLLRSLGPGAMVYLWGVKARHLESLVTFLYRGEVSVYRSDLADFMALAGQLPSQRVAGLAQA